MDLNKYKMKKTLLFTLPLLFLSLFINAQGNLQFNKAKLIGAQIDSVPTGKVWKIESVMPVGG